MNASTGLKTRRRKKRRGILVTIALGRECKTYAPLFIIPLDGFNQPFFFQPRSYVDFITHSSNCRSWTRHVMQILLKWHTSVFVMLVLKKRIRFTESLPLPDSEDTHNLRTNNDRWVGKKKVILFYCNACQL